MLLLHRIRCPNLGWEKKKHDKERRYIDSNRVGYFRRGKLRWGK